VSFYTLQVERLPLLQQEGVAFLLLHSGTKRPIVLQLAVKNQRLFVLAAPPHAVVSVKFPAWALKKPLSKDTETGSQNPYFRMPSTPNFVASPDYSHQHPSCCPARHQSSSTCDLRQSSLNTVLDWIITIPRYTDTTNFHGSIYS
jgi:hypothetical protein